MAQVQGECQNKLRVESGEWRGNTVIARNEVTWQSSILQLKLNAEDSHTRCTRSQ